MGVKYVHYGSKHFDPLRFTPVSNQEVLTKPKGGFWASPIGCKFGWKEWCEREGFADCDLENSFTFTLSEDANILHLNSVDDLDNLPRAKHRFSVKSAWAQLDFEKLYESGIDAIQLNLSEEVCTDISNGLYFRLYGWDCDSILVMNKDVISIPTEANK